MLLIDDERHQHDQCVQLTVIAFEKKQHIIDLTNRLFLSTKLYI